MSDVLDDAENANARAQHSASTIAPGIGAVVADLSARYDNRVSQGEAIRRQHANALTWHAATLPDAVFFAADEGEVREAVKLCAANDVPIVPFGTGTSLEGHINAPKGGLSIDVSQMNAVLEVNPEDLTCRIQPGVTRKQLNTHLRDTGLFFPIDPGADASLGGMAATRASGTNAVRYGTMRENVMALRAVLADGTAIATGRRVKKSSAGYDLTHLLVGSEGTLGIFTELTLKLHGIPEKIVAGVCAFPTVQAACETVILVMQCGIPIARIELLDTLQVQASNAYSNLTLEESPTLFLEFHGTEASVAEQVAQFGDIAGDFGAGTLLTADTEEERSKLWQARHDAYWSGKSLRPGADAFATDVCVPISRLADCVTETQEDLEQTGLVGPIVGHVGDGNFHVTILVDKANADEIASASAFSGRLVERALAMDGTCTGEHGIGEGKMGYLRREHGEAVDVMQRIKLALDPGNIMNPGKIFGP
ncbi:MAG: FAD-linked oxidase C-terminal domain-containing protein [Pseudomonadota bacterium]